MNLDLSSPEGDRTPTPETLYRVDRPIGETFSRWQTSGLANAGSQIYSVVGVPIEQMIALRAQAVNGIVFFRAEDRPLELENMQVVLGTVKSFGPGRWSTPDGKLPLGGCDRGVFAYTPATITIERVLQGRLGTSASEIEVHQRGGLRGEVCGGRFAEVKPLVPGDRVLLFLHSIPTGGTSVPTGVPAVFRWTMVNWMYRVEGSQVTTLGIVAASARNAPFAAFEVGVADAFAGVSPREPSVP